MPTTPSGMPFPSAQMMMFNPAGGVSSNLPSFLADLVSRLPEPPRFEAPVINVSGMFAVGVVSAQAKCLRLRTTNERGGGMAMVANVGSWESMCARGLLSPGLLLPDPFYYYSAILSFA